ncbi:MAG: DUF1015 domain-containing protein [Acidobacteria bacterium]|nr:MAG: DUF1015 domain-containing protein [Acidobacteriota bacterium]
MAAIRPFRAIRPLPAVAPRVAAVPYDVVDTEEARALAAGNPLSFLHVSRAEIDLPDGTDPHGDLVYRTAAERYRELNRDAPLVQEKEPSLYLYHLDYQGHGQTGVVACYSLDEYDANLIRKHERTRKDKEDDRTRHIVELRAQTGPVFLAHRPNPRIDDIARRVRSAGEPLIDFTALDGIRHAIWRVDSANARACVDAFETVDTLYIADGHHRAASAARARDALRESDEARAFLAVAFPADQLQILPYNRVVRDLNGMTPTHFLGRVAQRFAMKSGCPEPFQKGEVSMYVAGQWYTVDLESGGTAGASVIDRLDGNLLQDGLLSPILGIRDVRTDARIDFVGGVKGTRTLEQLVDSGRMAVAFSMYPVSIVELMDVSDAGEIMPPKSTWFEPKLRDGLLIHEI